MAKNDPPTADPMELTSEEIDDLSLELPLSKRRLITSSADFSVDTLVSMLRHGALEVPQFQRKYIWSDRKASRLIESLIMQCPIPVIYLNRRDDEVLEVVDGNQRVRSLRRYLDGSFSLTGLTAYPELTNSNFDALDKKQKRQITNRTIRCVIIEPESNPRIKFDVFERLNSGSTPLSPQELRHGLHFGPFAQMLGKLSANAKFAAMCSLKNDRRMKGDELVLRFFAFMENLDNYEKPLSAFLTDYLMANASIAPQEIAVKANVFKEMIDAIDTLLGMNAFRLRSSEDSARKFNTAYYDAVTVGYVTSELFSINDYEGIDATALQGAVNTASEGTAFLAATVRATSDKTAIERRISIMRDAFNRFA